MKIRNDFVTNSSSSSFIIARKEEFTPEQEKIIIEYAKEKLFGVKIADTKEELDKYVKENFYFDPNDEFCKDELFYKKYEKAVKALENGLSIYSSWICFEECEYSYGELFQELWDKLERANNKEFVGIETDLDY